MSHPIDATEREPVAAQSPATKEGGDKYDNFYTPSNSTFYKKFQYETLDRAERRIRLLRIHTLQEGQDNSTQITCDLLDNIMLEKYRGNFMTISYCAGDPKDTEEIIVNSIQFNVFARLGHALRQARYFWKEQNDGAETALRHVRYLWGEHNEEHENIENDGHDFLLWADQVCINQSDPAERAHQVGFMGDVYAAATQVVVSLSGEGDRAGGADWLERNTITETFGFDSYYTRIKRHWESLQSPEESHFGYHAFLSTILSSPYWTRAWVRQEYLRSHRTCFMAQYEIVPIKILQTLSLPENRWELTEYEHNDTEIDSEQCCACQFFPYREKFNSLQDSMKEFFATHVNEDLLVTLSRTKSCQSSDPRDQVYAFLGISQPNYGIVADYSAQFTLDDLYCKLAREAIIHHSDLSLLYYNWYHDPLPETSQRHNLPSWVPYWPVVTTVKFYSSPKYWDPDNRSVVQFLPDSSGNENRILKARGIKGTEIAMPGSREGTFQRYGRTSGRSLILKGEVHEGDELWALYRCSRLLIFRRDGQYHKMMGFAYGKHDRQRYLIEKVNKMFKTNDPDLQTILIC